MIKSLFGCLLLSLGLCCSISCKTIETPTGVQTPSASFGSVQKVVFVERRSLKSLSDPLNPTVYFVPSARQPYSESVRKEMVSWINSDSAWKSPKALGAETLGLELGGNFVLIDQDGKGTYICNQTAQGSTIRLRPIASQKPSEYYPAPEEQHMKVVSSAFSKKMVAAIKKHHPKSIEKVRAYYKKLGADFDSHLY